MPTSQPAQPAARPGPVRPPLLLLACALVGVEVLALVAAALVGVVLLVRVGGAVGPVLFLVLLALGAAVLLGAAARGLWRGQRWGRGPVLTAQIFGVVTAATWWTSGAGALAIVPLVVVVTVAVAVLTPSVVAATSHGRPAEG